MPTYEYACSACGHHFEEFQSIKAKPTTLCPECGKRKVRRLISAGAGLIFKGSGFYITDYRSESYKAGAKGEGGGEGGEKKPETKPADSKPRDSKSTEAKTTESRATETKPAQTK